MPRGMGLGEGSITQQLLEHHHDQTEPRKPGGSQAQGTRLTRRSQVLMNRLEIGCSSQSLTADGGIGVVAPLPPNAARLSGSSIPLYYRPAVH